MRSDWIRQKLLEADDTHLLTQLLKIAEQEEKLETRMARVNLGTPIEARGVQGTHGISKVPHA